MDLHTLNSGNAANRRSRRIRCLGSSRLESVAFEASRYGNLQGSWNPPPPHASHGQA